MDFNLPSLVKTRRQAMGMSQVELAAASGVSLPMIQLIESGRSNPTVPVCEKILHALGLEMALRTRFSWMELVRHGGPLFSESEARVRPGDVRSNETLKAVLVGACLQLEADEESGTLAPRKKEAVEAMLLAYRLHYPLRYERLAKKSALIGKFGSFKLTGRHIKLKRVALEYMREYL